MTITAAYEGGTTIHTTEWSLPNNAAYAAGSPITATGVYQARINLTAMAAGDQYQVKLYDKISSTGAQVSLDTYVVDGKQTNAFLIPSLILMNAWDVTVKQLARFASATASGMLVEWGIHKLA